VRLVVLASPSFAPLSMLRDAGVDFIASDNVETLRGAVRDAEAILVAPRAGALLPRIWPDTTRIRWVHTLAAGVDTLLFPELLAGGVTLTNARGVFAPALAEFVLAAMLWFAKDLGRMQRNQEASVWDPFTVERLEGQTVGIVGFGSIGRAVGERCSALGMKILATRRQPDESTGSLDQLLSASDFVVLSMPLTPETRGLIGARELARMKPTAVLINIARGAVIDEPSLIEALENRRIRGAALDVFETEPLPTGHPFWSLENVLLSPHCGDHVSDSHTHSMTLFLENLARFERGERLLNVIDRERQY
jgi:phosphoglycerate dehydrogenase-like enzyme